MSAPVQITMVGAAEVITATDEAAYEAFWIAGLDADELRELAAGNHGELTEQAQAELDARWARGVA